MIQIGNTLISDELIEYYFNCDLTQKQIRRYQFLREPLIS